MKSLLAAALTAIVMSAGAAAMPDGPGPVTYHRGWAIQGSHPYFQVWNSGPGQVCFKSVTVTTHVAASAVFMIMDHPLPVAADSPSPGPSNAYGVTLGNQPSQAKFLASVGDAQYGGQLHNFNLRAGKPYTWRVDDCLKPGKGLGIRYTPWPADASIIARIGATWTE